MKTIEKHEGSIGLCILSVQHKLQDLQTLHQSLSTSLIIKLFCCFWTNVLHSQEKVLGQSSSCVIRN